MDSHTNKKRKLAQSENTAAISDPRFANIQSDPRYRLPSRKNKIKLDKRFARALNDEDFSRKAKVDRYGRPLNTHNEKQRLKRKYEIADEESDEPDDDEKVQRELQAVKDRPRDILREGKDSDLSSSDSSSDDEPESEEEIESEAELAPQTQSDVPTGEVSSRLAVVNLDWDNIRAEDLMAVFSSSGFLGADGKLLKVAVFPSEYGKERMQREETEGPPAEIFAQESGKKQSADGQTLDEDDEEMDEDDETIKKSLLQPTDSEDFNSSALRAYQLSRLRYFYAVLTFSSAATAKSVYDAVDGTEYLSTANFFDLRFVPDDVNFNEDTPREECTRISEGYKPNDFATDALRHSKVKLTWDADDGSRKEAQARAFRGSRKDVDEADLAIYLGSDSSSEEEEDPALAAAEDTIEPTSKKDVERSKMRSLLGLSTEPTTSTKTKEKTPLGGIQVTFSAGLSSAADTSDAKRSVFENSPEPDETTLEKYVRKERERKKSRKDKLKAARTEDDGTTVDAASKDQAEHQQQEQAVDDDQDEDQDMGFNDPFFAGPETTSTTKSSSSKQRREERLRRKQEREEEETRDLQQKQALRHLMNPSGHDNDTELRHFNMKDIEKAEKAARKAEKKKSKKQKKSTSKHDTAAIASTTAGVNDDGVDNFQIPTTDPRFASRLFDNHEFAIDPTNPRYKETKGMKALLEEGRRRKARKEQRREKESGTGGGKGSKGPNDEGSEVKALVEKLMTRKV